MMQRDTERDLNNSTTPDEDLEQWLVRVTHGSISQQQRYAIPEMLESALVKQINDSKDIVTYDDIANFTLRDVIDGLIQLEKYRFPDRLKQSREDLQFYRSNGHRDLLEPVWDIVRILANGRDYPVTPEYQCHLDTAIRELENLRNACGDWRLDGSDSGTTPETQCASNASTEVDHSQMALSSVPTSRQITLDANELSVLLAIRDSRTAILNSDLAVHADRSKATVEKCVRVLENHGLIQRKAGPRSGWILTQAGLDYPLNSH